MTPLGRPTNYTNPDSAGLLDPRPDDDPLNINPVLEAQSVVAPADRESRLRLGVRRAQDRDGLTYRMNFGPDYTQLNNGCYNGPWTHGTCANLGANSTNQGQPPQAGQFNQQDFTYTLDNLAPLNKTLGGIASRSTSRDSTASSTTASRRTRSTRRTCRTRRSSGTTSARARRATK